MNPSPLQKAEKYGQSEGVGGKKKSYTCALRPIQIV